MGVRRGLAETGAVVAAGTVLSAAVGSALLGTEAYLATRRTYLGATSAPPAETVCGESGDPLLRLVLLGDSTAAGVGAAETAGTIGACLAALLAPAEGRRVEVRAVAVSGSRAGDLGPQVSRALLVRPDVALVLIGANDALRLTGRPAVRAAVSDAVRRLVAAGVPTVVGSCPDLGAVTAFQQPLRSLAAWQGRRVGEATRAAAAAAGGVPVDLAALAGAAFRADPVALFAADRFHPSSPGYAVLASALLPATRSVTTVRLPS
jgi:lysophospholipase L1-like esterase